MSVNTETIVNQLYAENKSPKRTCSTKSYNATKKYNVADLKQTLDSWKLVLVSMNNLIEWEGKFDPAIIVAVDTLIFGLVEKKRKQQK